MFRETVLRGVPQGALSSSCIPQASVGLLHSVHVNHGLFAPGLSAKRLHVAKRWVKEAKKNPNTVLVLNLLPFEVVLEATAFSLMSWRADEPLVATMVSTFFFFSAAELAWDWVSMATVHSSAPHGDGITCQGSWTV